MRFRLLVLLSFFACTTCGAHAQSDDAPGQRDMQGSDIADSPGERHVVKDRKDDRRADGDGDVDIVPTPGDRGDRDDQDSPNGDSPRAPSYGGKFGVEKFQESDYIDTDFGRHTYGDPHVTDGGSGDHPDFSKRRNTMVGRNDQDSDSLSPFHWKRSSADDRDARMEAWRKLAEPTPPRLDDWVPGKADPLDNGGFGLAGCNGSPVPYRLSGHVDFQKGGFPWTKRY